jgi:tetratricopeptide (TPR) repeat protein
MRRMNAATLKDAFALHQQGQFAQAERAYAAVLEREPRNFQALHLAGVLAAQTGQIAHGIALIQKSLALEPRQPLAQRDLGNALQQTGQFAEALVRYDRALALKPAQADVHNNRGGALAALGQLDESLKSYAQAIALKPGFAQAHNNRGAVLLRLARAEDALADFEAALALEPNYAKAHDGRGMALAVLERPAEALESFDRAIACEPDFAMAHVNRGAALMQLERPEGALESYDRALALTPGLVQGHINRGVCLASLKRYDEALASHDCALALDPGAADAQFGRATSLLIMGRFAEGWQAYEGRKRRVGANAFHPQGRPQWAGEDISGKSLFIEAEQGLGDMIQFCRFAPLAADRGAQVILTARPAQMRLLRGLDARITILPDTAPPDDFDYYIPLMSLAAIFRESGFAAKVPYLHAEADSCEFWRQRIGTEDFKIGVCWHGAAANPSRSFPLASLQDIARQPGVRLISLQKGAGTEQLATLPAGMTVETLGPDYDAGPDAFVDAAAAMESMDLIISCDTAIAHLAGALARPVWLALKDAPDWRWLLERDNSPWYPTMRLFRQSKRGDWNGPFAAMGKELIRKNRV